jgi:hypothetical protein
MNFLLSRCARKRGIEPHGTGIGNNKIEDALDKHPIFHMEAWVFALMELSLVRLSKK